MCKPVAFKIAFLILLLGVPSANAQSIFSNTITGTNPSSANPYTAGQTVNANITVSGIGRGSGITAFNANDRYAASDWSTGGFDSNDYFSWTLTPNAQRDIDFTSLNLTLQRGVFGPTSFQVRSSVDGFGTAISSFTQNSTGAFTQSVVLSGPSFQNITSPITFRLYGFNATDFFGIGNNFSVNDFSFQGTITPEPATTLAAAAGGLGLVGLVRRRFRKQPTAVETPIV